jgi:transglutaminase-like putative cysteine protease
MEWNNLFNLFLAWQGNPKDETTAARIAALRPKLQFGGELALRTFGQGSQKSAFTFKPAAAGPKVEPGGDVLRFSFAGLPERASVPYVSVTATVTSEAFAFVPTSRKAGRELLGPTDFWPVQDADVAALARKIASGAKTGEQQVAALLEWLMPGKNIQFGGPVTGSRYGVKKVLEQRFGHCWDFSDCFVTLARASGIPCRQVAGWLHGQSGHIWAEVLLEGKGWQQVDPTAGMACGSEYIPWLTSETGEMCLVYLSMPEIQVLDGPALPREGQ